MCGATLSTGRARIPFWGKCCLGLLFAAACVFGALEVHSSTDTWIGLAAGRQILTSPKFPVNDTFSYTFNGQPWFNQNWLSHVYFWLLYDHLGPDAVIYGTWAISAGIFTLVLLATRVRTGSWVAAFVTGALTGIATRDWVSARPATMQFFLLAGLWLALSALLSQGPRRRWWPLVLVTLLFLAWPHSHGSFAFGYGLVGLFGLFAVAALVGERLRGVGWLFGVIAPCLLVLPILPMGGKLKIALALALLAFLACAAGTYWRRDRAVVSTGQVLGLIVVVAVTIVLALVFGPFGLENFTHQFKVAESPLFRQIGEWHNPFHRANLFPPVQRFWLALAIAAFFPIAALVIRTFPGTRPPPPPPSAPRGGRRGAGSAPAEHAPDGRVPLQIILVDLAAIGLGLAMAFWARRFAPYLYILGGPALAFWTLRWTRVLAPALRTTLRDGVLVAAGGAAVATAVLAGRWAYRELADPAYAGQNLLTRVTRAGSMPVSAIEFFQRNQLPAKIFTEWKVGGLVMFHAPCAQVYIDGRSQQVYSEAHYVEYMMTKEGLPKPGRPAWDRYIDPARLDRLEALGTDAVLLPSEMSMRLLVEAYVRRPGWVHVVETRHGRVWLRRDSQVFNELLRMEQAGTAWWPDDGPTSMLRGALWLGINPFDPSRAIAFWRDGLDRLPEAGRDWYPIIAGALRNLGHAAAGREFFESEQQRWTSATDFPAEERQQMLAVLDASVRHLSVPPGRPSAEPAPGRN